MIIGVILTWNEEGNMERCISSLRWCDRVCVVDSGSADRTQEVAKELGVEVFEHRQEGVFLISDQRNWSLDNCGVSLGDWVLFLDADEVVPEELAKEVRRIIALGDEVGAYELTPRYLFWGRWLKKTQGFPNWHPRLLQVGKASFAGGVWEHFAEGVRVGRVGIPYDHYANSKGFTDWLERHGRYSDWDSEKIVDFLETKNSNALATTRKLRLRIVAAKFWPLRPLFRFVHMYFFRGGIFEGREALVFCLHYAFYEFMTVVKVAEKLRKKKGLSL